MSWSNPVVTIHAAKRYNLVRGSETLILVSIKCFSYVVFSACVESSESLTAHKQPILGTKYKLPGCGRQRVELTNQCWPSRCMVKHTKTVQHQLARGRKTIYCTIEFRLYVGRGACLAPRIPLSYSIFKT